MGNPKQKWTAEEEEALRAGIEKYGAGKWKFIQRDPDFNKHLQSRTNIDLKDKWRNMSAANGQGGSREKSRMPKPRSIQDSVAPMQATLAIVPATPVVHDSHVEVVKDDQKDPKVGARYNAMLIEALSTTEEPNGLDISSLMSYIEKRAEVHHHNFRKQLGSRLRRLVAQEKIEKVDNCYRIKDASSLPCPLPLPLPEQKPAYVKEIQPRPVQTIVSSTRESLDAAAPFACLSVAKAEDFSYQTKEAVMEHEKILKLIEEQETIVEFATEILTLCTKGKIVRIPGGGF